MMPHSGALHGQSRKVQYWARDLVHHGLMGRGDCGRAEQCFVVGLIVKLLFCCGPLLKEICHSSEEFCLR